MRRHLTRFLTLFLLVLAVPTALHAQNADLAGGTTFPAKLLRAVRMVEKLFPDLAREAPTLIS